MEVICWGDDLGTPALEDQATMPLKVNQAKLLSSVERALTYYESYYRNYHPDLNYHIWQLQACQRYCSYYLDNDPTPSDDNIGTVAVPAADTIQQRQLTQQYLEDMTKDLVSSRLWAHDLAKGPSFYPNISTLPVVCGLDTLVDVWWLMKNDANKRMSLDHDFPRLLEGALRYLTWAQVRSPNGGLGYGGWSNDDEQRLDVSGHAVSALSKLLLK
jgi:hypothetical protein